jgi:choline dehydrogenase-like flavoprotein
LPLGIDIEKWLKRAKTPWDAFPDAGHGKMDAESCGLRKALSYRNVEMREQALVERLLVEADGKTIAGVEASIGGERKTITARIVVVAAGAVNSAALLLASREDGLANRSGAVGRHFMNHNCSAVLAIDPRSVNDSVYQKTLGINDFYLDDGRGGPPLGNIQLLGRVTAPILKSNLRMAPEWMLQAMSRRSVDWYLMSEDLPNPESRVTLDGGRIRLDWKRSNWSAHEGLVKTFRERLRAAGYPIVLTKPFDRRTPSHQCGTVRIGGDPSSSPLDPWCRAWDHPNLFVVDASFLPTSAAVNPSLTIAAQALRVADHIAGNDLRSI